MTFPLNFLISNSSVYSYRNSRQPKQSGSKIFVKENVYQKIFPWVQRNMSIDIPTRKTVRKTGYLLAHKRDIAETEIIEAIKVLSHWRIAHAYPMATIGNLFHVKLKELDLSSSIVAQRLKRTPSIIEKLKRFPTMQLDRMQDIGELRIILPKVEDVYRLYDEIIQ